MPCQGECRTRSNIPLALAIMTPRAGTDAGNTALNVTVDIAKDEPPCAEESFYDGLARRILKVKKKLGDPAINKETTDPSQIFWEVYYVQEKQSVIKISLPRRAWARQ